MSQSEPLKFPDSYTGMDDILIPDPPFKYVVQWQEYIFRPVLFLDQETEELEYKNYIIVRPFLPIRLDKTEALANTWLDYIKTQKGAKIEYVKVSKVELADKPAYCLEMKTNDYLKKGTKKSFYEITYLVELSQHQIASFTSTRLFKNKNNNRSFGPQWTQFLKSIRIIDEPQPYNVSTQLITPLEKNYLFHNFLASIPTGTDRGLHKWVNKQNAERLDTWKTPDGAIKVKYKISAGYDFSVESGNSNIKTEKQGMASNATAFLKEMNPDYDTEHEYLEAGFAKDRKIFGYIEKTATHTGIVMEVAYKHGRTISIKVDGQTTAMEKNHDLILKWLPQFVILPDNK